MQTKKQLNNRRYYLHRRVKPICNLIVRQKTMFVTQVFWDSVDDRSKGYMVELRDKFSYSVQLQIA